MQALLRADGRAESGGSPLVLHNERLADPLDEFVREIAQYSKKRAKVESDHLEIARLEFLGGLYTDPPLSLSMNGDSPAPGLPAWNLIRCLQEGGKRRKLGADVLRGVHPIVQHVQIGYDGPTNPHEMWVDGRFSLRKTVGIQKSRTMRTRPLFTEWSLELPVEVDPVIFDLDVLAHIWGMAGTYAGLGEMRPIYGRFAGTVTNTETGEVIGANAAVAA